MLHGVQQGVVGTQVGCVDLHRGRLQHARFELITDAGVVDLDAVLEAPVKLASDDFRLRQGKLQVRRYPARRAVRGGVSNVNADSVKGQMGIGNRDRRRAKPPGFCSSEAADFVTLYPLRIRYLIDF